MTQHDACPACGAAMPAGAVLCTACGLHTVTGRKLAVTVDAGAAARARRSAGATVARRPSPLGHALTSLIKPALWLIVLGAIGWVGWRMIAWLKLDPAAHQRAVVAKLARGMTVQQIVDVAGEPTTVYRIAIVEKTLEFGTDKLKVPVKEDVRIGYVDDFMQVLKPEDLRHGFCFVYSFFAGGKYRLDFGPDGVLNDLADITGKSELR